MGLFFLLTVFRIVLFLRMPLAGAADVTSDDWNLLNHAWQMQQGNWLGTLQDSTLSYGVSFPFFVFLCNKLCIPLMLGVAFLYIGSILYFLHAWKTLIPSRALRGILYIFFLYSPVMLTVYTAQRAWDLTLTPSLIFLLLAFGFQIYEKREKHLLSSLLVFSAALTFFFYLRKNNHWILPLLAGFLVFVGRQLAKDRQKKKIALLLIPFLVLIGSGAGIAGMNYLHYRQFKVYDTPRTESKANPSPGEIAKDTLLTVFHMSANQMTDVDTYQGSGGPENLRFVESITGSQVIYPSASPLRITGWAFPTDERGNLEIAVTDENGSPLVYAQFENSEDVYMENPDYTAARVSRFTLHAPAADLNDASLTVSLNGELLDTYPLKAQKAEKKDYHLSLESVEFVEDPALYTTQKTAKISKMILFLYKIPGIPFLILTAIAYIGISLSLKSGNRIFQRWIFLTGIGLTALYSVILNCALYPSAAGLDPGAYSSGAWTLTQILMALCVMWFIKPLKLGKKK